MRVPRAQRHACARGRGLDAGVQPRPLGQLERLSVMTATWPTRRRVAGPSAASVIRTPWRIDPRCLRHASPRWRLQISTVPGHRQAPRQPSGRTDEAMCPVGQCGISHGRPGRAAPDQAAELPGRRQPQQRSGQPVPRAAERHERPVSGSPTPTRTSSALDAPDELDAARSSRIATPDSSFRYAVLRLPARWIERPLWTTTKQPDGVEMARIFVGRRRLPGKRESEERRQACRLPACGRGPSLLPGKSEVILWRSRQAARVDAAASRKFR
jgi:hypothetical protein